MLGWNIEQQVLENVARAEYMDVQIYGGERVQVRTTSRSLKVELHLRECTCRAWKMSGIPCPHACAAIKGVHGNVYSYVDECPTITTQEKIYS
ncbi:hypothetical protein K1719_027500 [Acacia pycnantha]|nr:hypothetical protein K1719_027500 [Acacia pycnantha]